VTIHENPENFNFPKI